MVGVRAGVARNKRNDVGGRRQGEKRARRMMEVAAGEEG